MPDRAAVGGPVASPRVAHPAGQSGAQRTLSVLIVEDSDDDATLEAIALKKSGYGVRWQRVEDAPEMNAALDGGSWEVVLCDHSMPRFDSFEALAVLHASGLEIPLIIVSGAIGEEAAVSAIRAGAADYVSKDRLGRLGAVVRACLDHVEERRAREAAELGMREAQERFRRAFDEAPIGMAMLDLDGRFVQVNEALCEITGYAREQLEATSLEAITHPDDLEAEKREIAGVLAGEAAGDQSEKRLVHAGRSPVWVAMHTTLLRDADAHPLHALAQIHDITDRKRAEKELAHITGVLERTQEISKTGGWEYDVAAGQLTWTDEVYRIYGVERSSDPTEITEAIAAYDPESAPIIEAAFRRLVADGEPYDLELGLIRADGQRIWVRTIGRPVIEHGRVVRVGGFIADVTDRNRNERALRQAREELELAQRIAELGSFSTNPGPGEMVWSAEMFRIFGRDPGDGVPRANELLACIYPEDREIVRAAYDGVLADDARSELDFRIRVGDGAERVLHLIVSRDPDRNGLCSGTVQDVTRVRAVERELREQSARAESASRAKSEFLARMSHELRTPLNSIIGFSQLLELEGLDPRQSEHVGFVLKAGGHLLELINEVLELAKIEAGPMTISPEPVALADAIREALALVAPLAAERDVTLASSTDGLAQIGHVHGDRQRLEQVLLNVLTNAIKYNRAGGCVDVSSAVTETGRVRTTIADTGIGIAPDQLGKLFEPFERLGAELTQIEGTGLGLALSKRLLEAMGGTIEVASQPGTGTDVTIELAGAQAPVDEHQPGPHDPQPADLGSRADNHQVILYIEDNLSNLTLVERILERYPAVEVIPAMQATIGLELARQHRPDLIVLDLHLPDMPGTEVLQRLKTQPPTREIPVIVLTADASKSQLERVTALGASDYVTKPLNVSKFLEIIADNLAERPSRER